MDLVVMLFKLLTFLGVPYIVYLHRWPIVSCLDDLQEECSVADVTTIDPFMELEHYTYALVFDYTSKEREYSRIGKGGHPPMNTDLHFS